MPQTHPMRLKSLKADGRGHDCGSRWICKRGVSTNCVRLRLEMRNVNRVVLCIAPIGDMNSCLNFSHSDGNGQPEAGGESRRKQRKLVESVMMFSLCAHSFMRAQDTFSFKPYLLADFMRPVEKSSKSPNAWTVSQPSLWKSS